MPSLSIPMRDFRCRTVLTMHVVEGNLFRTWLEFHRSRSLRHFLALLLGRPLTHSSPLALSLFREARLATALPKRRTTMLPLPREPLVLRHHQVAFRLVAPVAVRAAMEGNLLRARTPLVAVVEEAGVVGEAAVVEAVVAVAVVVIPPATVTVAVIVVIEGVGATTPVRTEVGMTTARRRPPLPTATGGLDANATRSRTSPATLFLKWVSSPSGWISFS